MFGITIMQLIFVCMVFSLLFCDNSAVLKSVSNVDLLQYMFHFVELLISTSMHNIEVGFITTLLKYEPCVQTTSALA